MDVWDTILDGSQAVFGAYYLEIWFFFFKSTSGFHISSRETTKLASLYTGQNIQITKHLCSGGIPGLKKHVIKFQISLILDNVA